MAGMAIPRGHGSNLGPQLLFGATALASSAEQRAHPLCMSPASVLPFNLS